MTTAILLLGLAMLMVPSQLAAEGKTERDKRKALEEAQASLDSWKVGDALKQNMEKLLADPDLLEKSLELLDKTLPQSEAFTETLKQFLSVDFSTEKGIADGKEILKAAQGLEEAPSKGTSSLLNQLQARLLFEETSKRYNVLMDGQLVSVRAGDYYEAIEGYVTGFEKLARDTFEATDYEGLLANVADPILKVKGLTLQEAVGGVVAEVEQAVKEVRDHRPNFERAVAAAKDAAGRWDAQALLASLPALVYGLDYVDRRRDAIVAAERRLSGLFNALLKLPDKVFENYLWFSPLLIRGRDDAPREGIYQVLELLWERAATEVGDLVEKRSVELLAAAKDEYRAGRYAASEERMASAYGFATELTKLLRTWGTQFRIGAGLKPTTKGFSLIAAMVPRMVAAQERAKETLLYRQLAVPFAYLQETQKLGGVLGPGDLSAVAAARTGIDERRSRMREIRTEWATVVARYQELAATTVGSPAAASSAEDTLALVDDSLARFDREDTRLAEFEADIEYAELRKVYDGLKPQFDEGKGLISGVTVDISTVNPDTGEEMRRTRTEKYPARGRDLLSTVKEKLSALQGGLGAYVGQWQAEAAHVRASAAVQDYLTQDRRLSATIDEIKTEIDAQVRLATNNLRLAEENRVEGRSRYEQAKADLVVAQAKGDLEAVEFESAVNNADLAIAAYGASLDLAEDPEARRLRDDELTRFANDQIQPVRQRIVTKLVRAELTEGERLYGLGQYETANEAYTRAQTIRARAFAEPDAEVERGLAAVRTALQFSSQLEIPPDNPQYDVVSQLYNNAVESYNAAVALMSRGQKVDAVKRFDDAKKAIADIRLLVPFHWDAGLLACRVFQQLKDNEGFRLQFAALLTQAKTLKATLPGKASGLLQGLAQIKPDDPDLVAAMKPPVAQEPSQAAAQKSADQAEFRRLYEAARVIFSAGRQERYAEAVGYLDQAIEKSANVDAKAVADAKALKDEINTAQKGTLVLALDSDAELQYQEAVRRYRVKDFFGAKAIVDQLMQDPKARNYRPLMDLDQRVRRETG